MPIHYYLCEYVLIWHSPLINVMATDVSFSDCHYTLWLMLHIVTNVNTLWLMLHIVTDTYMTDVTCCDWCYTLWLYTCDWCNMFWLTLHFVTCSWYHQFWCAVMMWHIVTYVTYCNRQTCCDRFYVIHLKDLHTCIFSQCQWLHNCHNG